MKFSTLLYALTLLCVATLLSGCASLTPRYGHRIYVSVPDQKMVVLKETPDPDSKAVLLRYVTEYPVSTSKFGLGSRQNSNATPLGKHTIAKKIGGGVPLYMKFKDRRPTGEIVPPNTPGRDPIVSRILWLKGMEPQNANSFERYIYIHGTPEEERIGQPASYGCIRMKSVHVAQLYELVEEKDEVTIVNKRLNAAAYLPPLNAIAPAQSPLPAAYIGPPGSGQAPSAARKIVPEGSDISETYLHRDPSTSVPAPDLQPDAEQQLEPHASGSAGQRRAMARYERRGVNAKRMFQ